MLEHILLLVSPLNLLLVLAPELQDLLFEANDLHVFVLEFLLEQDPFVGIQLSVEPVYNDTLF